jgi:hypothetical protein
MARVAFEGGISVNDLIKDENLRAIAFEQAQHALRAHVGESRGPLELGGSENTEAIRIAENYGHFLASLRADSPIAFFPKIRGAGFLGSVQADLSAGDTLYEVKTVNRNIAGKDLRQLITYLALQVATGERRWNRGGFFNPRRALTYQFSVDEVIYKVSGGRAPGEVFQEVIDFLSTRAVEIDAKF